jgi:hypothetical protein
MVLGHPGGIRVPAKLWVAFAELAPVSTRERLRGRCTHTHTHKTVRMTRCRSGYDASSCEEAAGQVDGTCRGTSTTMSAPLVVVSMAAPPVAPETPPNCGGEEKAVVCPSFGCRLCQPCTCVCWVRCSCLCGCGQSTDGRTWCVCSAPRL